MANQYISGFTQTWNSGGTTFYAIKANVTDAASASDSKLIALQVGGDTKFSVSKDGAAFFDNPADTLTNLGLSANGSSLVTAADYAAMRTLLGLSARGHIFGLNGSNAADADHDVTFTAGEATSTESDPVLMVLGSAITKQSDATFSAGTNAGGMVSGESLPTSGTIHWWLIAKADGTTDICCNNNAASGLSPTLPTDFIHKRRIRSDRTDSSANIVPTTQRGDEFLLKTVIRDLSQTNPGTAALTPALSVPAGIQVDALIAAHIIDSTATVAFAVLLTSLDQTDVAATGSLYTFAIPATGGNGGNGVTARIRTNTSRQIRARLSDSASDITLEIFTSGWIDPRGKDA
jgi:hypothetical protein